MNELERQCFPTPQLLFLRDNPYHPYRSHGPDRRIAEFWATEALEILDPFRFPNHQEWNQANTEQLNAEIFMMPSGPVPIGAWNKSRLRLGSCFGVNQPAFKLRPPQGNEEPFSWAKNIRAPATIRSVTFSEDHLADGNLLKLYIPKWLSEYGDLRLYEHEYRTYLVRNHPFFSNPNHCE